MRYAPMFMAYQRYVLNYEPAKLQLKELAGKVNGVSLLIHNFCTTAKVISLDTFLILPIQRLTRYEMLLGNILKQTSQRHDDFENLLHSLSTLKEINDDINKKKEEADNAKRLEEIESNLIEDHYAIPKNLWEVRNRVYIREGSLFDNSGTWSKRRTAYYYFMFSDIMIKTRTVNRKKGKDIKYAYLDIIPFSKVVIGSDESQNELMDVTFSLVEKKPRSTKKPRIQSFACISENEKKSWIRDIEEAINLNQLMAQVSPHDK